MPAPPFLVDITCLNISRRHMPTDLEQELKQTRPFKSPHEEAFVGLQRTAALLEHAIETLLKPSGVTATQYNVLRILRGAGEQGLCRSEVGQRMVRRVPDVTRLLDRMEEAGLVTRERSTEDRRLVRTRITPDGLTLLDRLEEPLVEIHREQLGHLSRAQLQSLIDLLALVRQGG